MAERAEPGVLRRTRVHGVDLAWEEHGGGGGRALVLVHGFTGSRRDFAPRVPALAALGRTVLPDLRGHGDSGRGDAAGYTLEQLAADLVAFLDAAGLGGCDLLGHSLGGMVALRAALAAPERIGSLLLMDTAARAPDLPVASFQLARQVVESSGLDTLLGLLRRRGPDDPNRTPADRRLEAAWGEGYWRDWRIPNYRAMDPVAYGALGDALFGQAPLARLAEIRMPTLVLVGAEDTAFLAAADELVAAIPGARRVTIAGAGHQPQLEAPAAWLQAIRDHLAQVRGGTLVAGP
jgi:pimeloyl-ACP methyl ester carboxylesterase